ncbi:uncharacterized protein VTP21DRAFT_10862 [Calcarisporiella thermophila]|uniref:uncharacterized protein n=1 Tax=Calcarisporiella thermophila TaxID=911321 RepID=UPI003741F096
MRLSTVITAFILATFSHGDVNITAPSPLSSINANEHLNIAYTLTNNHNTTSVTIGLLTKNSRVDHYAVEIAEKGPADASNHYTWIVPKGLSGLYFLCVNQSVRDSRGRLGVAQTTVPLTFVGEGGNRTIESVRISGNETSHTALESEGHRVEVGWWIGLMSAALMHLLSLK